tara:strand:- start:12158 stop:13045 length:888 start_codon:yes stop_codon:yes gene_type:complete
MTKVFITGANGFTALSLTKSLEKDGFEVTAASSKDNKAKNIITMKDFSQSSFAEILNLIEPDFIIHLAAISSVIDQDDINIFDINSIMVRNLLNAASAMKRKPKKIILSSSANLYGPSKNKLSELSDLNPTNIYSMSKLFMEEIAKNFFYKLNIVITRPFNYSGPLHSSNFLLPKIAEHFSNNKKEISLGNTNIIRDFSYIDDVVTTYKKLMLSSSKSEIINICSSKGQSISEIIKIFESICGYTIKVNVSKIEKRENDINIQVGCNKKLLEIINFSPKPFSKDHATLFLSSILK